MTMTKNLNLEGVVKLAEHVVQEKQDFLTLFSTLKSIKENPLNQPFLGKDTVIPSLPQNQTLSGQSARKDALAMLQKTYILSPANHGMLKDLQVLKAPLPKAEEFSNKYILQRGIATVPLLENIKKTKPGFNNQFGTEHFAGIADYEALFIDVKKPAIADTWLSDEHFAEQRLSGLNPVEIKRIDNIDSFPEKLDTQLLRTETAKFGQDIDALISANSLYIVDLTPYLEGIEEGGFKIPKVGIEIQKKYLPKAIALFYWDANGAENQKPALAAGRLLPLAIQLDIDDDNVKILTPASPEIVWTVAKICFSIADANVHEMSTHLGHAHFGQEAFGVITPAQLADVHPIHILLKPHLRFMTANNQAGVDKLVQKGGPVDLLMAATLEGSLKISLNAAASWSVTQTFPESIKARKMQLGESLAHYAYRDDGLLIWGAVAKYVNEYIDIYYKNDGDVSGDFELQAWAKELAGKAEGQGRVCDMPAQITSVAQLCSLLAVIIFQNSAGHSSINYPQYPYLSFCPNMPLAGYANYREFFAKDDTNKQDQLTFLMDFLPPQALAVGQIDITNALSNYQFDELGDYTSEFSDPMAKHVIYQFTQDLGQIEEKIAVRNRERFVPYSYMLPSNILNSASI
jgi:arachidonate 15-lipoxygenase